MNKKLGIICLKIVMLIIVMAMIVAVFIMAKKHQTTVSFEEQNQLQQQPVIDEDFSPLQATDKFTLAFLQLENKRENLIYSPLSIKYALKMLEEGAAGNTKEQIENLVGRLNVTKYANIDKVLSLANAVFIRNTYSSYVKNSFQDALVQKYNAELKEDPFQNAQNINQWIENKTLGIIKNILNDQTVQDPNCEMLLINALAIDMEWEDSFDSADTMGKDFNLTDGSKMQATTMYMNRTYSDSISYYQEKDITALAMDLKQYHDTQLQFVAIMPEKDLSNYVENITQDKINEITKNLIPASKAKNGLNVYIPRFSFDYSLPLKKNLQALGITDAFNSQLADFSNMSQSKLHVGDALHKADIEFSERGIKAAAVTIFTTMDSAIMENPSKPEEIKIDQPFLFLIKDKKTDEIWFVGTVYEPNSWENDQAEYRK